MEEKVLYENGNVKVTSSRFVVGGKTYQLAQINSSESLIEQFKTPNSKYILMGIGAFLVVTGIGSLGESFVKGIGISLVGAAMAFVGFKFINQPAPLYHVRITTSSGEASAVSSHDEAYIDSIVNAINNGLAMR